MKIYLTARFGRRDQLRELRAELQRMGHVVTSRWLDTTHEPRPTVAAEIPFAEREQAALDNLEDIMRADCLVSFTEEPDSTLGKRGGRHVEHGLAYQMGKRVIIVGPRENLFHWLPRTEHHNTHWDFLRSLAADDHLAREENA